MPRAVAATIARAMRSRIDAGEWAQDRLPPERALAADFGVARNTVRRAMALLRQEGAAALASQGGGSVASLPRELADTLLRMQGASPADMMEIRLMLEPGAAGFAATAASASDIADVAEAHRAACAALDMPAFEGWDAEFHHRIVICSRNDLLNEFHDLLRGLRNQSPWFEMKRRSFSDERRRHYCNEHAVILDALQRRDPDGARAAMLAHLLTVRLNMLGR